MGWPRGDFLQRTSTDIIDGWRGQALTKQKFSIHHTFKLQSDHNKLLLNGRMSRAFFRYVIRIFENLKFESLNDFSYSNLMHGRDHPSDRS